MNYQDPNARVNLDLLRVEITATRQGRSITVVQDFNNETQHLGSLSSFGSALQRITYEMLERAIKELTTP